MLKSILVAIDAAPAGEVALALGVQWATRFDAMLIGLGIVDRQSLLGHESAPIGAGAVKQERDDILLERERVRIEERLRQFIHACAQHHVASKVLEDFGSAHGEILREAERCDLVIIGKPPHDQDDRTPRGTIELPSLVKDSPRPIVAVPLSAPRSGPMLVAYDGSVQSARTLQLFALTGMIHLDSVELVTVANDELSAEQQVLPAVEFLRRHGINPRVSALAGSRDAANLILDHARRIQASLIVMGAYGQPAIKEFLMGSVTKTVLEQAEVPVFLYH